MKVRLALRHEGEWWNAYLARENTMKDAKLIGAILFGAAKKSPEVKQMFMDLMQRVLADAIEETTGTAPDKWDVSPAPESERSGHG